ncbi:MAG: hypothetical protein KDC53_14430 [Saprospiraceae bacterium]|nr:hypothetical protein [Saprospiraceae bacterium]
MKKWLIRIVVLVMVMAIGVLAWMAYNMRDRHPGYEVSISIQGEEREVPIKVGFGKQKITPQIFDTWNDINQDAKYRPDDGDTYNDDNHNGRFDAVWIAGFSNSKPANGIHDDVWARAVVIDDGTTRLAMVALDAVGFMYTDVVDIRQQLPEELNIDYTIIASTHTHESADLIGIWGPDAFHSGVNSDHMAYVKNQAVLAISEAVDGLRSAHILFAEELSGQDSLLIKDTRKPIVKATGIHVMVAVDARNGQTLGSIINWANHPETLWSRNLLISSDYPHYIRESMENGITYAGDTIDNGLGGISIFFNGAVGGLMTPHPSLPFSDPVRDSVFSEPSFEKTRTLGEQIALLSLNALRSSDTLKVLEPISLQAKSIQIPLENKVFRLASAIGLLQRGLPKWFVTRTEVAALRLGPAEFISIPGEIYPEIIYGGIESPPGQDFLSDPVEVPPLKTKMKNSIHFYLGLSNDEIGYIIPYSEWDAEEPWLYLDQNDTYGEENSLGPQTAPIIYDEISQLLDALNNPNH